MAGAFTRLISNPWKIGGGDEHGPSRVWKNLLPITSLFSLNHSRWS
jgi:hypothetical protein